MFHDGREVKENIIDDKDVWFLLELTDGIHYAFVEIQIDKETEMGSNVMNVKTIYKYFKTIMYVDKREWNEFFKCGILKRSNNYYLTCDDC